MDILGKTTFECELNFKSDDIICKDWSQWVRPPVLIVRTQIPGRGISRRKEFWIHSEELSRETVDANGNTIVEMNLKVSEK